MEDKIYQVTAVRCTRPSSGHDTGKSVINYKSIKDDHKVRYHEEDPSQLQSAKARRPRRHTTGGSQQKDAIERARQMIANDGMIDPRLQEQNCATLNRKELVSLLKTRYGNDIEKYRSLKKAEDTEVEHRNLIENGTVRPKKSHKILTYKTSSGLNGHSRKGSTSSQESSQASQESLSYSSSPAKYDSLSWQQQQQQQQQQQNQYEARQHFPQNRNGSTKRIVTRETKKVVTQQQTETPQTQIRTQHANKVFLEQSSSEHKEQMSNVDGSQHEREVLMTERQKHLDFDQQQQHNQGTKQSDRDRVLFLQYKDEIKRVNMPNSISSLDTLKALFVTSFPGKLSMVRIDDRGLIYIKDKEADVSYELEDLRDIQPRALVQLRERITSYDSLSSSQNDMNSYDSRYPPPYNFNTLPVRGRRGNEPQQQYAESLQDFPTRPRSGSGDSLRSDSFLSRPQRTFNQPKEQVSYVNSGLLSPRIAKKQIHVEQHRTAATTIAAERPRFDTKPVSVSGNAVRDMPVTLQEPPKLKQRKRSEKECKGPTVEDQLADLTRLLHTAMHSDEEDSGYSERDRAPGKLDQHVLDNLVQLSEANYSKSPTKGSCYAPTALLEAKKREVEAPMEEQQQQFRYDSIPRSVQNERQGSFEDPNKGYMHEGPDVYMREGKKKDDFESGLADSLLKSLQTPSSASSHQSSSSAYARISSSPGSQVKSPPAIPSRNPSSRIAVHTLNGMNPAKSYEEHSWSATATTTKQVQMDKMIGIASSAASLRNSVLTLRSQLDELRLLQTNQSRSFKGFLSQSMQEFNALAAQVSQNARCGQESGHSIRDRRFRVQEDYDAYLKKQGSTSNHLSRLEEETEHLRREVVQRKRVLQPNHVTRLNSELESLGKYLAELKSRFSGLHDMLKIVMAGELEIIVNEERFLKDEPGNLDNLYARCKHLSGTLFTLQRLASVQQMARTSEQQQQQLQQQHQQHQHDVNQNRVKVTVNQHNPMSNNDEVAQHRTATTRTVRFTSEGKSGYL